MQAAPRRSKRLQVTDTKPSSTASEVDNSYSSNEQKVASKIKQGEIFKPNQQPASVLLAKPSKPREELVFVPQTSTILKLPPELLSSLLENITNLKTISALAQTCKAFYMTMTPKLYGRLAVAAMFHAHIPKLIRNIEPLLPVNVKKQLKKEGRYGGQQEKYSTKIDGKAVPTCASYVRQVIVGVCNPGRKHQYIVERYVEEAFKVMTNVELLETRILTKSMGASIAALKHLKALAIYATSFEAENMEQLVHVRDLKHLKIELYYDGSDTEMKRQAVKAILQNSCSTLRSLNFKTNDYMSDVFETWKEGTMKSMKGQERLFQSLKRLELSGYTIDTGSIQSISRAIDFTKLQTMELAINDDHSTLFSLLQKQYSASKDGPRLRTLRLDMSDVETYGKTTALLKAQTVAKCEFLASFHCLKALDLSDCGHYKLSESSRDPGLPAGIIEAVLEHPKLEELKFSYKGIISGMAVPYLPAGVLERLLHGLPNLRNLQFAPDELQMERISEVLSQAANLTSITCFPHDSWLNRDPTQDLGRNIIESILKAFLNKYTTEHADTSPFTWESHYKLRYVSLGYKTWEIATMFPKTRKGEAKAEKIVSDDTKIGVMIRDVPDMNRIHVGYDPEHEWIQMANQDLV